MVYPLELAKANGFDIRPEVGGDMGDGHFFVAAYAGAVVLDQEVRVRSFRYQVILLAGSAMQQGALRESVSREHGRDLCEVFRGGA